MGSTEAEGGGAAAVTVAEGAPAKDRFVGMMLGERYRVLRLLGEGGMGKVYLAEHEQIGKKVAIKCLSQEMASHPMVVERFRREARAATAVGNEHIVDVTDMGETPDGAPYIVMEALDGIEFGDLIEEVGAMPIGRSVRIVRQACDALAAAHDKGIVHRDLKPENLFLVTRGGDSDFVKVLDFGISKFQESANGANASLTQTGMTMGTPLYMSPEQAQGLKSTDHRTDIYSLGVILYMALTGRAPFHAETFPLLIVAIVTGDVPSIRNLRSDIPVALDFVIQRCLAKDPDERFSNCLELAEALKPFADLDGEPALLGTAATVRPPELEAETVASGPKPLLDEEPAIAETRISLPETPRRGLAIGAVVGVVALGGLGLAFVGAGGEGSNEPTVAVDAGVTPFRVESPETQGIGATGVDGTVAEAPAEVRLQIVVAPAGARIFLDDEEFPNPLDAPRPRSLTPVRLRVEMEGYSTLTELLVLDEDRSLVRSLESVAPATMRGGGRTASAMRRAPMESAMAQSAMETASMETVSMDSFRDDF